ncbi:hypothetical protein [Ralstonia pseudosolanacearum]|uniref:hypothetical protein n=1 Tax=Ralstonia pseudosolanacearum TaxID=1310165 RepID=UPI001FFA90C2|nr:hypothetical protein [Ralstonia pseudosolanacearum]
MQIIAPNAEIEKIGNVLACTSAGHRGYQIALSGYGKRTYKDGDILLNVVDGSWREEDLAARLSSFGER